MVTVDLFQFNSASYPIFCCLFKKSPGHPAKISSVPSVGLSHCSMLAQWFLFRLSYASLFTIVGFFSSCLLVFEVKDRTFSDWPNHLQLLLFRMFETFS